MHNLYMFRIKHKFKFDVDVFTEREFCFFHSFHFFSSLDLLFQKCYVMFTCINSMTYYKFYSARLCQYETTGVSRTIFWVTFHHW